MHDGSIEEKSIPQHRIHKVRKRLKMSECIHANSYTQKSLNSQYVNWLNTRELEFHENAGFSLTVKWRCSSIVV